MMSTLHLAGLLFAALAAACFLLDAFGTERLGGIGVLPLGLLFAVVFLACMHLHHSHTA
jgi:hypothetical protein